MAIGRLKPLGAWLGRGLALAALVVGLAPGGGAQTAVEATPAAVNWPDLGLGAAIGGFDRPAHITHAGDGSGRLFVVERPGRIRLVKNGALAGTFLDITSRVESGGSEQGLLSLVFPPGYGQGKGLLLGAGPRL